jgi:hypothetical protein
LEGSATTQAEKVEIVHSWSTIYIDNLANFGNAKILINLNGNNS